jgi:hypothetical protein
MALCHTKSHGNPSSHARIITRRKTDGQSELARHTARMMRKRSSMGPWHYTFNICTATDKGEPLTRGMISVISAQHDGAEGTWTLPSTLERPHLWLNSLVQTKLSALSLGSFWKNEDSILWQESGSLSTYDRINSERKSLTKRLWQVHQAFTFPYIHWLVKVQQL